MKLCPSKNDPSADLVMTPPALAAAIVNHFAPRGYMCDPCIGEGAFKVPLEHEAAEGFCEYFELSLGRDFLTTSIPNGHYDWIITNPPWSKFKEFLKKSMRVSDNVVFLATLNHFTTKLRMRMIQEAWFGWKEILLIETPPKPWPPSGFQVAAVHLKRGWVGDCKMMKL